MKSLHYCLILAFLTVASSLSAQVIYSQILDEIYVGPENVVSYNSEVIQQYQQRITSAIEQVDSIKSSHSPRSNQSDTKPSRKQIKSELNGLSSILNSWQNLSADATKLSSDDSNKQQVIGTYVRLSIMQPPEYRTIMLDNSKVKSEEVEASLTMWRKCGGIDRDCLSADPNDCLTWAIQESRFIIVDSQGFIIPFDTVKRFYKNFRVLDDEVECQRILITQ